MLPIAELRVSIPLAISVYKLSWQTALVWSLLGNIAITAILMFSLDPVACCLRRYFKIFDKVFAWLFSRTRHKHSKMFEIWGSAALVIFVAIPLPGTGAWSGCLAAFVFGIKPKKAIPLISLGLLIAGIAVTVLTVGIRALIFPF